MQILRFSHADGGFPVRFDLEPEALDFAWPSVDGEFRDDAICYLWLRQPGHFFGRVVMAWSSPVRVTQARRPAPTHLESTAVLDASSREVSSRPCRRAAR